MNPSYPVGKVPETPRNVGDFVWKSLVVQGPILERETWFPRKGNLTETKNENTDKAISESNGVYVDRNDWCVGRDRHSGGAADSQGFRSNQQLPDQQRGGQLQ